MEGFGILLRKPIIGTWSVAKGRGIFVSKVFLS